MKFFLRTLENIMVLRMCGLVKISFFIKMEAKEIKLKFILIKQYTSRRYWKPLMERNSYVTLLSNQHGCISDVSLRRFMQRLRNISKRADLQISETSSGRLIKDFSTETFLRSLRFSQRCLWVASEAVILDHVQIPTSLCIFC